jgi:hypothetical protein
MFIGHNTFVSWSQPTSLLIFYTWLRKVSADSTHRKPQGPADSGQQVKARLLHCPVSVELAVLGIREAEKLMNLKPGELLVLGKR